MKLWIAVLLSGALWAAEDVPAWVRQAAAIQAPEFPAKVGEVVLLHEETLTVAPDGKRTMRERGAVRIVQTGGSAMAVRTYDTHAGRIADFRGWLVPPSGKPVTYGKDHIADVALDRGNLYDEARSKVLRCPEGSPRGSVFAYEVVEEEKTVFTQGAWTFQGATPVLTSRFTLVLPPGWEVRGTVFNRSGIEPSVAGNQYTWELHDLPWIEREEHSPSRHTLVPWLGFSYFPNAPNPAGLQPLKDWGAVSAWLTRFADPAAEVSDAIRAKAAELTRNAPAELDKIRAIAAFVQQTIYVEVETNLTHGGGYTPHPASQVLSRNYGDCKDKVALMRALLAAAGIASYDTSIFYGDRRFVRSEWPSTLQFNHAIIAIKVPPAISLPTVMEHPALGRLLMFDPTSRTTPVGELPDPEQGSLALVSAGPQGVLLEMPRLPANMSRMETSAEATLDAGGHLEGKINRQYFGESGGSWRRMLLEDGAEEVKRSFERTLARRIGAISLKDCTVKAAPEAVRLDVHLELGADRFAQALQGRLLLVRPGMLGSISDYGFTARERKLPVELNTSSRHDVVRIKLPAGFRPDEVPPRTEYQTPYGVYQVSWRVENGEVVFEQSLEVREGVSPAAEYSKLREFFEKVLGAQNAAVVLVRQ